MIPKTVSILDVKPASHQHFSCGRLELDEYLKRYAKGNHKKGLGKSYVLQNEGLIVGYYTISMSSIEFASLPEESRKGMPKYPIPVARIGRLAVDNQSKGKGMGKVLLVDALYRIWNASQVVAAYAVVVDAKDEESKTFYMHYGFIPFQNLNLSLFLPLQTIQSLFA